MYSLSTFYQSDAWQNLRARLMLERGLVCEYCGKPIVKRYDCIGHHKTELTEDNVNDFTVSLNPENVILVHHKCHNLIHERFGGFCQKVFLVYGSPCAGKTTWVKDNAQPDDLIIDIDRIWEAVSNTDRLNKPNRLKANVFAIRDLLIDQVRTRTGKWRHAYVIGTYPLEAERSRLCATLGAEPVLIDTDMRTCLERAPNDAWRGFIRDWFEANPSPC